MNRPGKNILVVCGPNASGKTRLGVSLARPLNGEILSADSRQVYRGMDIGTGKDIEEYETADGSVPYHLIDIADPSEIYTVCDYQRDCYAAIESARSRGRLPIMVGGTGLYIEAVLKHYRIPAVPEDPALRKTLMRHSKEELASRLHALDRDLFERTDRQSKKRIIRALEIGLQGAGRKKKTDIAPPQLHPLVLAVRWPRKELVERIDARVERRLAHGMVEEIRQLLKAGIDPDRFALFGMEYRHVARFIEGAVEYDKMVAGLKTDIHRLAKRQMTWFRGMERRGIPVHWVDRADYASAMAIAGSEGMLLP
ncbi:MAG: tRNA (adenosine(37)-N6)-dimethylallyltransferase MiaA [Chitinivibrionales bacterium]|nr:tRNA (adenosine(37)-N6)-dimethylallyltransferase MiaA [Chitinivibrionales bacterium]MBD3395947.1 tRNA (adenosine(37)-N6)-dimethylallyltransferase MiaA [Chitinivibrionales bacterium]